MARTTNYFMRHAAILTASLLAACVDESHDGKDDDFISGGKADDAFAESSAQALGVLAVVNTLGEAALDDDVDLHASAARNIAAHRAGPDATLDTPDDDPFDSLAELDAVSYVGPVAFAKLLSYAQDNGYITGWTQESSPSSQDLSRISGLSPTSLWAVGDTFLDGGEHVVRRTASGWAQVPRPFAPSDHITSVHVISDNDVWIGGYEGSAHWDGQSLTLVPELPRAWAFWSRSAADVWAVLSDGIAHFDGTSWTTVASASLDYSYEIEGTSPNDIWIASGGLWHYDGATLSKVPDLHVSSSFQGTYAIAAIRPDDVWAGANAGLYHYDGATWSLHAPMQGLLVSGVGYTYPRVTDIFARSSDDVYFVRQIPISYSHVEGMKWRHELVHWNGSTFEVEVIPGILAVIGVGPSRWLTGKDGLILHQ
jgi:hypothetical protein